MLLDRLRGNLCARLSAADVAEVLTRIDDKRSVGGGPWRRYNVLCTHRTNIIYIHKNIYYICMYICTIFCTYYIMYEALGRSIYRTPNASARAINNIGFIGRRWVFIDHLDAAGAGGEFKRAIRRSPINGSRARVLQEQRLRCSGPDRNNIM